MKISKHSVVSVKYMLTGPDGSVLDSSSDDGPFVYLHGAGDMIPGLEKAMEGRSTGDKFQTVVQPDDAYGEHRPELVQTVPRTAFQGVDGLEAGAVFSAEDEDGSERRIAVIEVDGDNVKIDGNHPLAGLALSFDLEILDVRAATAEEIEHGHPHGSSCCGDDEDGGD